MEPHYGIKGRYENSSVKQDSNDKIVGEMVDEVTVLMSLREANLCTARVNIAHERQLSSPEVLLTHCRKS